MRLLELIEHLHLYEIDGQINPEQEVHQITQDTREVVTGDVFICIVGTQFDGHTLAREAAQKGAVAIVAQKKLSKEDVGDVPVIYVSDTRKIMALLAKAFYGNPSEKMRVVGVTGTNGKTTITYMVDTIAKKAKSKSALVGTLGMQIENVNYTTMNTTPDIITIQRNLAKMVEEDVSICSLEVSSHALVQGRTWGIEFDVAVLSNLTHEHLDYHLTMRQYAHAKELLFSQLGSGKKAGRSPVAIINKDDGVFAQFSQSTPAEVISYSTKDKSATFYAANISYSRQGTTFELKTMNQSYKVSIPAFGEYNVQNALAALAATCSIGIPLKLSIQALGEMAGVPGRLQQMTNTQGYEVIVDYAHTPDGLDKVLSSLRPLAENRIISVFGCRGGRDKGKRPVMGQIAATKADFVVFTTDDPGFEDQDRIIEMVLDGVTTENYTYIPDRREAIRYAVEIAQPGDIVIITGRGHETTFHIKGEEFKLVDYEVAQEAVDYRQKLVL